MSETKVKIATPGCDGNAGVNCDSPQRCSYCGWNPAVSKCRIAAIRAGNLRTNQDGKKYLHINERGIPDAV